ncbi:MAG: hypothetical protein EOO99_11635 [Pedobacter sp.]|nr:MAG: hypothetical protein EOO99_11635 [Pedobacter sp.]
MRFLKITWQKLSRGFLSSLIWIFLLGGSLLFALGTFVEFSNPKWGELCAGFGKTIIAGGILSVILKSMQFMGVIKEELSKIISDPEYMQNRNDLHLYWAQVTRILFKNKFPDINQYITHDIKEMYLPTNLIHYYDECSEILSIKLIDKVEKVIEIEQRTSFTIIPNDNHSTHNHPYKNYIRLGKNANRCNLNLDYVTVNGRKMNVPLVQEKKKGFLSSSFAVDLYGHLKYKIEFQVTKTYSLSDDNVIAFRNNYIHHNYRLQFFLKGVTIDFHEAGTLSKFKTIHENESYVEKQFTGLLYKGQGYIVFLDLKKSKKKKIKKEITINY